jgi:hypothetical protein
VSKEGLSDQDEKYNEIALELLSKLRQCLADDALMLISAKVIRLTLLHKYIHPSMNNNIDHNNFYNVSERLAKVALKITQSLIEHFDEDRADDLCETLLCLSKVSPDDANPAIAFVSDYIQTSLENDVAMSQAAPSTSATMLKILGDIITTPTSSLSRETIVSVVDLFVTVFFGENIHLASTCCSAEGRKAVEIGGYLVTNSFDHNITTGGALQASESNFGIAVRDIVLGIPKYVEQWGGENIEDTIHAIRVLRDVARRCRKENDQYGRMDQLLLSRLRESMEKAWFSPGSKMLENFVFLPEAIQCHIVSLVAIIESPTEITLQALGTICGRLRFLKFGHDGANHVVSFIVNCVHNVRKTVPMQQYIRFVMDSSGSFALSEILNAKDREQGTMELIMKSLDYGVLDSSSCLVQCGTAKVLPMLEPLLMTFLQKSKTEVSDFASVVQSRAAISLLAVMSLDTTKYGSDLRSIMSVFDILPECFRELTVDSIRSVFLHRSDQISKESAFRALWIRPIISVLSTEASLFHFLVDSIFQTFTQSDSRRQTLILDMLLEIVESSELSKLIKLSENALISWAESVEYMLNDNQRKIAQRIQLSIRYA